MKAHRVIHCLLLVLSAWAFCLVRLTPAQSQDVEPKSSPANIPDQESGEGEGGSASASTKDPNYLLGPEDVLVVNVFNVPELSKLKVRVANDGTISVPLLGPVKAAGLTTPQLRSELESMWGESYLQNPQVDIFIEDFHGQQVSVIGAVDKPGLYPLTARRTIIDMLSLAGGLSKKNSVPGPTVYVTRKDGFPDLEPGEGMRLIGPDKVEIDLRRLFYSNDASLNIIIKPYDIISVSKAGVVYVVGEVRKPGGFVVEDRETLTVLQALALAEGTTGFAAKRKAEIIRRGDNGSRIEIPVDLEQVLKGKSKDVEMAANDVLFVPQSKSKAGTRITVQTALATLPWMFVYGRF